MVARRFGQLELAEDAPPSKPKSKAQPAEAEEFPLELELAEEPADKPKSKVEKVEAEEEVLEFGMDAIVEDEPTSQPKSKAKPPASDALVLEDLELEAPSSKTGAPGPSGWRK